MTIKTPITFVIGAGASCAYGLPTAPELKKSVIALSPDDDVYQFVFSALHPDIGPAEVNAVRDDLRNHSEDSVDAFLEKTRPRRNALRIGKMLVAGALAKRLVCANDIPAADEDWLGHVLRCMLKGARDCEAFLERNAKVQFVTFNFDTFIERRIRQVIGASGMSGNPDAVIASLTVTHVHGELPPLPECPLIHDTLFHRNADWIPWLNSATGRIHVTSDELPDEALEPARKAVREASILCFLGFGYSSENLARLGLPESIQNRQDLQVFGSACGLSKSDVGDALDRLRVKAVLSDNSCRKFLGEHRILREH